MRIFAITYLLRIRKNFPVKKAFRANLNVSSRLNGRAEMKAEV